MTYFHFDGKIYHSFADLCNAFYKAKGYYPAMEKTSRFDDMGN